METNFTFLISPADAGALEGQVSRALEKRVELASRERMPKLWELTDKLNSVEKAPEDVLGNRRRRRRALGFFCWLLSLALIVPCVMQPRELLWPLIVGAACFVVGSASLWRNAPRLLGAAGLIAGALLCFGALAAREELGVLLWPGIVCLLLGIAGLLKRRFARPSAYDRAAKQLLSRELSPAEAAKLRVSFSDEGMSLTQEDNLAAAHSYDYGDFECVVETADLLMPVYAGCVTLLQKKDLLTGTLPELREFLAARVKYAEVK